MWPRFYSCFCSKRITCFKKRLSPTLYLSGYRLHFTSSVLSQKKSNFFVYHIDSDGNVANYEIPKATFYNELGLSARDLRFQHSHILAARNSKIVIRIQKLKAVICQNAVLLVDTVQQSAIKQEDELSKFFEDLPSLLCENKLHSKHLPFEYKVLEAILSHGVKSMTAELRELEPKILELLDNLTDPTNMDVDRSLVHILLRSNASLNKFSTVVKEYCQMLEDILDYEDDLKDLCISVEPKSETSSGDLYTAFVFTPTMNGSHTHELRDNHMKAIRQSHRKFRINLLDEMELLLDSYLKEGEEITNKVSELKQAIEDSNSAILINLDSAGIGWRLLLRMIKKRPNGGFSKSFERAANTVSQPLKIADSRKSQ